MQYLVFNPTWTVPPGIMRNDVLPGVRKDPEYFAKKNMVVFDNAGAQVDPAAVDWNKTGAGSYTVRQTQGKTNALGAVKFIFPNTHSVYLHDTPSKELFNKAERAFSSGCIRVEKSLELAEYLLNDSLMWNRQNIDKLVATNRTQTVELKNKPIVYLLYSTAYTDMEGVIHFRKDIYDRDEALINALEAGRQ
jgi:murein L,D-transpeptidase YcbB/YkuD